MKLTIVFTNGVEKTITLNNHTDVRVDKDEGVVRFGRDDGRGWRALITAPLTSVLYWG